MRSMRIRALSHVLALLAGQALFGIGGYWCVMYHLSDDVGIPMVMSGFLLIGTAAFGLQEEYDRWALAKRYGTEFAMETRSQDRKRAVIHWDMDGLLAIFKKEASPEATMRPGYFYRCRPDWIAILSLVIMVIVGPFFGISNRVLSCAWQNGYAERDKTRWLKRYGLGLVPRTFVPCGEDKADYIDADEDTIIILVDDRSLNLFPWEARGFVACKYYNGINGNNGTWRDYGGYYVSSTMRPWQIAATLIKIVEEERKNKELRSAA